MHAQLKLITVFGIIFKICLCSSWRYIDNGNDTNVNTIIRRYSDQGNDNDSFAEAIPNWTKGQLQSLNVEIGAQKVAEFCNSSVLANATVEKFNPGFYRISLTIILSESSQAMFPKKSPHLLFRSPHFHLDGNVTIFFTGWQSELTNKLDPVYLIHKAYKCRAHHNFLIIDTGAYVETLMQWASYDYQNVAKELSEDMVNLLEKIDIHKIHLIGHGIGAHIAGIMGRYFYNTTGKLLPRITGLDPANSCLLSHDLSFGLQKGDAEFVDIIHSNQYVLGSPWSSGDVDFYLYGVKSSVFGCADIICQHHRAIDYFASTVLSGGGNFTGCKSLSIEDAYDNYCFGEKIRLGINTPNRTRGNYIVSNIEAPSPPGNPLKCGPFESTN